MVMAMTGSVSCLTNCYYYKIKNNYIEGKGCADLTKFLPPALGTPLTSTTVE